MAHYRVIEITNLEPLKIGAKGFQSSYSEPAKDYVPGSTLRGAIIGELVRRGVFNEETKSQFLLGMECYNAYPYYANNYYLPTPLHLRVDKQAWRKANVNGDNTITLNNLLDNPQADGKNHVPYKFLTVDTTSEGKSEPRLRGKGVEKEYRLHHSTQRRQQEREKENLFRYQAISPGQCFRGIIKCDDQIETEIGALFEGELFLYLGGSKGSGYGKCKVVSVGGPIIDYEEAKKELGIAVFYSYPKEKEGQENYLYITCLSDCLFRNEYGQPINHLPESLLNKLVGKNFKLERQFVHVGKTEGYNMTWQARYPKESTVRAGSVFLYRSEEKLIDKDMKKIATSLEFNLIGERTQDGYGWLGVNLFYPNQLFLNEKRENDIKVETIELDNLLKDQEIKNTFDIMLEGLEEAKLRWLRLMAVELKNSGDLIINLNNNQIQNMIDHLDQWRKGQNTDLDKYESFRRNDCFSLMKVDFKTILEEKEVKELNDLVEFAKKKLTTQKGKLFYFNGKENRKEKDFILELIKEALNINRKMKRRG